MQSSTIVSSKATFPSAKIWIWEGQVSTCTEARVQFLSATLVSWGIEGRALTSFFAATVPLYCSTRTISAHATTTHCSGAGACTMTKMALARDLMGISVVQPNPPQCLRWNHLLRTFHHISLLSHQLYPNHLPITQAEYRPADHPIFHQISLHQFRPFNHLTNHRIFHQTCLQLYHLTGHLIRPLYDHRQLQAVSQ